MKIIIVAGARPNFVKIAPVMRALNKHGLDTGSRLEIKLIHTGQHHDFNMSGVLFEQLDIQKPDYHLGVTGGGHGYQTGSILVAIEPVMLSENPELVVVVGDVNSTLAGAICAAKLGIKIAHIEAGLRSYDRSMPEEQNRVLTDAISDYLFITEESARVNLLKEGISIDKIHHVGNVMIDSLLAAINDLHPSSTLDKLSLAHKSFILLTVHRPANVDNPERLAVLMTSIFSLAEKYQVVFPVHPRTESRLKETGSYDELKSHAGILLLSPQPYMEFLALQRSAALVLTDSGGIQEEGLMLNTPCVTLRDNTERPVTIESGMNKLCAINTEDVIAAVEDMMGAKRKFIPPYWDGLASERIAAVILREFLNKPA